MTENGPLLYHSLQNYILDITRWESHGGKTAYNHGNHVSLCLYRGELTKDYIYSFAS